MKPIGLHASRLKPERENPKEAAFVQAWKDTHEISDFLSQLLAVPCEQSDPFVDISDKLLINGSYKMPVGFPQPRDRIITETLIQWLGSECGMAFLSRALGACGCEIVEKGMR